MSGGQLQRVVLARALVLEPAFVVADEPVSMLDVSVRASVLNLMKRLSAQLNLAVVYISHDLSLIQYMCQRTAIMYLGRVVETGPTQCGRSATRCTPIPRRWSQPCPCLTRREAQHRADPRHGAFRGERASGLPLPPPLPVRNAAMLRRGAAGDRAGSGACCGVLVVRIGSSMEGGRVPRARLRAARKPLSRHAMAPTLTGARIMILAPVSVFLDPHLALGCA